jgi:predicted oxidoreductase
LLADAVGAAPRALDPSLRARLEIVSKAGIYVAVPSHPERTVAFYDASATQVIRSVEASLRLLRTDHLDVFLVHRPDWLTTADDTAEGLNRMLRDGKILSAGVSNYSVHQFEALNARMERPLVTNQVEFSALHMAPICDGTADQQRELDVPETVGSREILVGPAVVELPHLQLHAQVCLRAPDVALRNRGAQSRGQARYSVEALGQLHRHIRAIATRV